MGVCLPPRVHAPEEARLMTRNIVLKFPLIFDVLESAAVEMPPFAKILSVQNQGNKDVMIWAKATEHAMSQRTVKRTFRVVHTGQFFESGSYNHIGTVQLMDGEYVLHVFEETE